MNRIVHHIRIIVHHILISNCLCDIYVRQWYIYKCAWALWLWVLCTSLGSLDWFEVWGGYD